MLDAVIRVSTVPGTLMMGWDVLRQVVRGHRTPVRTPGSSGRASRLWAASSLRPATGGSGYATPVA